MALTSFFGALVLGDSRDVVVPLLPGWSRFARVQSLVQLSEMTHRIPFESVFDTQRSTNEWPDSCIDRVSSYALNGVSFPVDLGLSDYSSTPNAISVIAANFVSDFAGRIATFLLTQRELILNPSDPYAYSYERQMMFSLSENILHPSVSALVSVTDISTDNGSPPSPPRFREFRISTGTFKDVVPSNVMEDLVNELQLRDIRSTIRRSHDESDRITTISLPDCSADVIALLPLLEYAILGETGYTYIRLFGEDYIDYTNADRTTCELTLTSVEDMASCSIGLNTLRKTVLYIDNRNRMIGFGEII